MESTNESCIWFGFYTPVVIEWKNKTNGLYYQVLIVITTQRLTKLSCVQPGIIKKLVTCEISNAYQIHNIIERATQALKCDVTGLTLKTTSSYSNFNTEIIYASILIE